jgi:hypothetical protein
MLKKLANFAPVALVLPLIGGGGGIPFTDGVWHLGEQEQPISEIGKLSDQRILLPARYSVPANFQVRIEQRVVVRVSPRAMSARQNMLAELPPPAPPQRLVERKIGKCLPVRSIAAVQTGSGNRLLLFTRDRRIITAKLEKACRARDFYSGFYVEQNEDGMLCVDRDKLQSRAGANCEVSRIRQLVPESE